MKALALALILVVLPATVQAQQKTDRLQHGLLIVSGGLAGADLAVSMDAFARGTATEANPFLRPLVNRPLLFGTAKSSFDTAVILWLRHDHAKHPKRAMWATVGWVAVKTAVVVWNAKQLHR